MSALAAASVTLQRPAPAEREAERCRARRGVRGPGSGTAPAIDGVRDERVDALLGDDELIAARRERDLHGAGGGTRERLGRAGQRDQAVAPEQEPADVTGAAAVEHVGDPVVDRDAVRGRPADGTRFTSRGGHRARGTPRRRSSRR